MTGRPSKYSKELAAQICERIATSSDSLQVICKEFKVAVSSVFLWLTEHSEFSEMYTRAREAQADILADQILEIADDSTQDLKGIDDHGNRIEDKEFVNRSRLRVDARKWIASKLKPKKYGDKLDVDMKADVKVQDISNTQFSLKTPPPPNTDIA